MPDTKGGITIPSLVSVDDVTIETNGEGKIQVVDGFNGEGRLWVSLYTRLITQGTWTQTIDTSKMFNFYLHNAGGVQNDEIYFPVFLAKGTYTLTMVSNKSTNLGIFTFSLDDAEIGTIDMYNGSPITNQISTIANITVTESKLYNLKLKLATKNASSTGYLCYVNALDMYRTA